MLFRQVLFATCCCYLSAGVDNALRDDLEKLLARQAFKWNVSFSLGIYNSNLSIAVAKGINNHATGSEVTVEMEYPMGSITKSYTAVAALQLGDKGLIDLDKPMHQYVDPFLKKINATTLADWFPDEPRILESTTRQFLQMRSGLADYNDTELRDWTLAHPDGTYTPQDFVATIRKTLLCDPGSCGAYSSTGFSMVGLALAHITNCDKWEDFNQQMVISFRGLFC